MHTLLCKIVLNSFRWWHHLAINVRKHRLIWFIPMVAPPSDQGWETAFTLESAAKNDVIGLKGSALASFSYTYKAQNIVLNYSRCFTCQITCILYKTLLLWQPPDAATFDLSSSDSCRVSVALGMRSLRVKILLFIFSAHLCLHILDLAARTKTSTLNQSVSGCLFGRWRRHFTSRSFSKAKKSERFPLRDFEIPMPGHVRPLRLAVIYIPAAGNSIAVHDWPLFIQPDSSWVIFID